MSLKAHFHRFQAANPDRLHFAAHSHHLWPDVTFEAQQQAWRDAAEHVDGKWEQVVFAEVVPAAQRRIAGVLGLPDPATIAFAPNTHELLVRLVSCLEPPVAILTTDGEFHSFARQTRRWEEAGFAKVERVAIEPFATFRERLVAAVEAGGHDLVYVSHVFFDSGFVTPDLQAIAAAAAPGFVAIDGYHGFMALPTDLGPLAARTFYIAGGYKYAMAGEGACFMHCPPGFGERPVDTGWFAAFGELESAPGDGRVAYARGGARFAGATFDPTALYRLNAVLALLQQEGVTVADIHDHVRHLQNRFLAGVDGTTLDRASLVPDESMTERGHFLTFRRPDAGDVYETLTARNVVTDHRGDRLRIGFGIYHDESDVDELLGRLR